MNDSYSATRIHVMRTKLIKAQDYQRLMKMSDAEVIGFLQATEYKQEVNQANLEDLQVIDKIIAENSRRTLKKLQRISSFSFREALNIELEKNDLWNLLLVAQSLEGEVDVKESLDLYSKQGTINPHQFEKAKSIADLCVQAKKFLPKFTKTPESLLEFTNLIDKNSVKSTLAITKYLVDERNLNTIFRCKGENILPENALNLLERGGTISLELLQKAIKTNSTEEALNVLKQTPYKSLQVDDISRFSEKLRREILQKIRTATRRYPLGTGVLINYLAEKEVEHENLRLLIKGKRLGLEDEFIKEYLVWT